MSHGKTADSAKAAAHAAERGARVVAVTTKLGARRLHAALKRLNVGTRNGDTWTIGKGTIEVRT